MLGLAPVPSGGVASRNKGPLRSSSQNWEHAATDCPAESFLKIASTCLSKIRILPLPFYQGLHGLLPNQDQGKQALSQWFDLPSLEPGQPGGLVLQQKLQVLRTHGHLLFCFQEAAGMSLPWAETGAEAIYE